MIELPGDATVVVGRRPRRRLGLGLLLFGLTGIGLLIAGALLTLASLAAVDDVVNGLDQQRQQIEALLGQAATTLHHAGDGAANAGASVQSGSDAAAQAARLSARVANAFDSLASLGSISILGARPFEAATANLGNVAAEARTLSEDLARTSVALQTNVANTAEVAADLHALGDQLADLQTSLNAPRTAGIGLAVGALRIVLLGLLVWLAVPAIVSTWLGWRLWRHGEPLPDLGV
jgi:uncharacterized protein YukE